jgi:hypothetical protein
MLGIAGEEPLIPHLLRHRIRASPIPPYRAVIAVSYRRYRPSLLLKGIKKD